MLTKKTEIDKIEILRDGVVQVRESQEIFDGDELLAQRFRRFVLTPIMDPATIPQPRVRRICEFIWTPQVIADYQAAQAALEQEQQ